MNREHLIYRLEVIEQDFNGGRPNAGRQSLGILIAEIKAEGVESPLPPVPAPRRSPLADLPRGSKITIEVG